MVDGLKQAVGCNWGAYNRARDSDLYAGGSDPLEATLKGEITTYNRWAPLAPRRWRRVRAGFACTLAGGE
jgi:hypothetical protein